MKFRKEVVSRVQVQSEAASDADAEGVVKIVA